MSERDTKTPDCAHWRELLALRVDRELNPKDEKQLADHLEKCPACQGVASWMGDVDHLAAMSTPEEPGPRELTRIEDQIMESVRRVAHRPRRRVWQNVWIPSTAVAAVIALLTWMQSERSSTVLEPPEPVSLESRDAVGRPLQKNELSAEEPEAEGRTALDAESEDDDTLSLFSQNEGKPPWQPSESTEEVADARRHDEIAETAPGEESVPSRRQQSVVSVDRELAKNEVPNAGGREAASSKDAPRATAPAPAVAGAAEFEEQALSLRESLGLAREDPSPENVRRLTTLYRQLPQEAGLRPMGAASPKGTRDERGVTLSDSVRVYLMELLRDTEDDSLRTELEEALRE